MIDSCSMGVIDDFYKHEYNQLRLIIEFVVTTMVILNVINEDGS